MENTITTNYFNKTLEVTTNIIENPLDLDIERILSQNITRQGNKYFYPILCSGISSLSNKSEHFLLPTILTKHYIKLNYDKDIYDKALECFNITANGTGRFFEALSNENTPIDNSLIISYGNNSQGLGQVFATCLQNVEYIHIPNNQNVDIKKDYKNIIIYTNELVDLKDINNFVLLNNLQNVKIATIVDYTDENKENFDIISLFKVQIEVIEKEDNHSTSIITCNFPEYDNTRISNAINQTAKQDDNLIETIMTLMSSQDFNKTTDKIQILFVGEENNQYLAMLISEFMSGFDTYEITFASITEMDLDTKDKISFIMDGKQMYINGITNKDFQFMFYLTNRHNISNEDIYSKLEKLNNIQRKNILLNQKY